LDIHNSGSTQNKNYAKSDIFNGNPTLPSSKKSEISANSLPFGEVGVGFF
jgi:hypothetical protein